MTFTFRGRARFVFLAAVSFAATAHVARAQDTTFRGITLIGNYDPSRDKMPIAVLPIAGTYGDSIRTIVQRDLDFSDRFTIVSIDSADPRTLRAPGTGVGVNYALFQHLGVAAVVEITPVSTGLHVVLHDVGHSQVLNVTEFAVSGSPLSRDWRLGVHRAADDIALKTTGQRGIAATRIAYLRGNSVRVVDSDGADEITVPTDANGISPAWNPTATMLAYATYGLNSRIVLLDLTTGRQRTLMGPTTNVNYGDPAFTPDGQHVLFAREGEDDSDIYTVSVNGGTPQRLSVAHGATNAEPAPSPDGRRIAYVGNLSGRPELYIMDSDGTNADVLTNYDFSEQNYRSDPDWSPDGRTIAYQERINDRFQLRTIRVTGGTPKFLTSEGENQSPSWAPDSRHIVFTSTRTGKQQLWILDTESGRLRQLTTVAGGRLAAWSRSIGSGS